LQNTIRFTLRLYLGEDRGGNGSVKPQ